MKKSIFELIRELKCCCEDTVSGICEELDINPSEYTCLMVCNSSDSVIKIGDLCKMMNLSISRGGRVIEGLVQQGLLVKTISSSDARATFVEITKEGKNLVTKISKQEKTCEEKIRSKISAKELDTCSETLKKIILNLKS